MLIYTAPNSQGKCWLMQDRPSAHWRHRTQSFGCLTLTCPTKSRALAESNFETILMTVSKPKRNDRKSKSRSSGFQRNGGPRTVMDHYRCFLYWFDQLTFAKALGTRLHKYVSWRNSCYFKAPCGSLFEFPDLPWQRGHFSRHTQQLSTEMLTVLKLDTPRKTNTLY